MKQLHLLLLAALSFCAVPLCAQTVSNIHFVNIGDGSANVVFNSSAVFNADRIRYNTADCSGGSGGFVQVDSSAPEFSGGYPTFQMDVNISGLLPSTLYFVCPEVSSNSGSTWSSGASATFTTLARTNTVPIPPTPVPLDFPAQTGTVRTVLADCSNLQTQINAAVAGDTISIPPGTICSGNYTTPTAPEAKTFLPSSVQTGNAQITIAGHGFTENEQVAISSGTFPLYLPGMQIFSASNNVTGSNTDTGLSPWHKGGQYWIHVIDANNVQLLSGPGGSPVIPGYITFTASTGSSTITYAPTYQTPGGYRSLASNSVSANIVEQLACAPIGACSLPAPLSLNTNYYLLSGCAASVQAACTTQLSTTPGGTPITLTATGTGTLCLTDPGAGTMYIMPAPPALGTGRDILITSSGNLPPAGVRTSPGWDSQGFHFRQTVPQNALGSQPEILQPGILSHNYRIAGAIFDTSTNMDYLTTTDPRPYCSLLATNQDTYNFIFDRSRVQGPGYPNRLGCAVAIFLEGTNVGWINSDLEGMDYWHSWTTPGTLTGTFTSTTATIAPGAYHGGVFTMTTTGNTVVTVTSGGGVTGNIYVWADMTGKLNVLPPTGVSATCTTAGTTCAVLSPVASPTWPVDANGRQAGGQIAIITLTSGTVTANCAYNCVDDVFSMNSSEGSQAITAGIGPGPYVFDNDYISGTGIPIHFDDSGGFLKRGDYTITRNTFNIPASQMATGPMSNGLRYMHRNTLEWKGGQRTLISGNIFQGSWSEDSPACLTIANTARNGGYITDFDVSNNVFIGCGGLNPLYPIGDQVPQSSPGQRARIQNNLFLLNGWNYFVSNLGNGRGWVMESGGGFEDILVDHNTIYNNSGSTPMLWFNSAVPASGVTVTNNIYFYTGDIQAIRTDTVQSVSAPGTNCANIDAALAACMFNSLTLANNVLVPSWAATQTQSGFVGASSVAAAFPSGQLIPDGASQPANVALVNWSSPALGDYRLSGFSPYVATAANGTQSGADMDRLNAALGVVVQLRYTSLSATAATISATVSTAGTWCYAGYGTSADPTTWTWTAADATASRQRNITLSGLTTTTQYYYSLGCDHAALPATQTLRTY